MAFIRTVPVDDAEGAVADMYETDRANMGYVPNFTQGFSHRPGVYAAWRGLVGALRQNMDERRYELATIAAARRLRSSYCSLVHGRLLADRFIGPDAVRSIFAGDDPGLEPVDVAVMDLAEKVAADATAVTQADIDRLRGLGLTDPEILDVVTAAAMRCFFSKVLDGLGVQPDSQLVAIEPGLRDALVVGRPIASA
jgi:uncharacterized peroxidase-related enzyme